MESAFQCENGETFGDFEVGMITPPNGERQRAETTSRFHEVRSNPGSRGNGANMIDTSMRIRNDFMRNEASLKERIMKDQLKMKEQQDEI